MSDKDAFGILPNAVARDTRLDPAALVLLAYRVTFADTTAAFGLNTIAIRRRPIVRGKGLGRDVIEGALRQAQDAGYLERKQLPRRNGRFGYAVDKLTVPSCSQADKSGWIVRRKWFDGRLSLNALAAILYMRAGTGKGPIYKREVAERFGWSSATVMKALAELWQAGLIEPRQDRAADGTITSVRYWLMPWDSAQSVPVEAQGHGLPGNGAAGHTHTKSSNAFPIGKSPEHREGRQPRSRHAPPISKTADCQDPDSAFFVPELLGWSLDDRHDICGELCNLSDGDIAKIEFVCDDEQLTSWIMNASGGRVAPLIVTPAGLQAVRALAALIHKLMDGIDAGEALRLILSAVKTRIGDRPATRLSSLEVIGRRDVNALEPGATEIQLYEPAPPIGRAGRKQNGGPYR